MLSLRHITYIYSVGPKWKYTLLILPQRNTYPFLLSKSTRKSHYILSNLHLSSLLTSAIDTASLNIKWNSMQRYPVWSLPPVSHTASHKALFPIWRKNRIPNCVENFLCYPLRVPGVVASRSI
jgi:hypothetical protein